MTVRASSESEQRSTPSTVIDPLSGRSSPATKFSSVDLPMPDSPTIATNSPRSIEKVIDSNTRLGRGPAKVFVRLATAITAPRLPENRGRLDFLRRPAPLRIRPKLQSDPAVLRYAAAGE